MAKDETRFGLNGVHVEPTDDGEGMRWVATDGHRLGLVEGGIDGELDMPGSRLLPPKALAAVAKLADVDDAEVVFSLAQDAMEVRIGTQVLWARLIEGEFPDYRAVLPDDSQHQLVVERRALMSALGRSALMQSRVVEVSVEEEGVLEVAASSVDRGAHVEHLSVEAVPMAAPSRSRARAASRSAWWPRGVRRWRSCSRASTTLTSLCRVVHIISSHCSILETHDVAPTASSAPRRSPYESSSTEAP